MEQEEIEMILIQIVGSRRQKKVEVKVEVEVEVMEVKR